MTYSIEFIDNNSQLNMDCVESQNVQKTKRVKKQNEILKKERIQKIVMKSVCTWSGTEDISKMSLMN